MEFKNVDRIARINLKITNDCRHLKWRVLDHWRRLQVILKIEKETEERRERWRHKIYELLPDYTPNRDDYL